MATESKLQNELYSISSLNSKKLPWTPKITTATDCTFHQLAPYIGRIKTTIARHLIHTYTHPDDLVLDPFCGSGVIPLEASLGGRRVIAADINPYGVVLTKAKLTAPPTENHALQRLSAAKEEALFARTGQDLRRVPSWVRRFFHPETLRNALALRDVLVAQNDSFLLSCLLGILHHQRPGFLSFPSSHLVPYLRDKLFPRCDFPDLYGQRDVYCRMEAKIRRTYRRPPATSKAAIVLQGDSRTLDLPDTIDALITSPPYMNELDYVRDNRLRLWFLTRANSSQSDIPRRNRELHFRELMTQSVGRMALSVRPGGHVILVVGDTTRGARTGHPAAVIRTIFDTEPLRSQFALVQLIHDVIPDIRRSRRDLRGTKAEEVLVFRRFTATNGSGRSRR